MFSSLSPSLSALSTHSSSSRPSPFFTSSSPLAASMKSLPSLPVVDDEDSDSHALSNWSLAARHLDDDDDTTSTGSQSMQHSPDLSSLNDHRRPSITSSLTFAQRRHSLAFLQTQLLTVYRMATVSNAELSEELMSSLVLDTCPVCLLVTDANTSSFTVLTCNDGGCQHVCHSACLSSPLASSLIIPHASTHYQHPHSLHRYTPSLLGTPHYTDSRRSQCSYDIRIVHSVTDRVSARYSSMNQNQSVDAHYDRQQQCDVLSVYDTNTHSHSDPNNDSLPVLSFPFSHGRIFFSCQCPTTKEEWTIRAEFNLSACISTDSSSGNDKTDYELSYLINGATFTIVVRPVGIHTLTHNDTGHSSELRAQSWQIAQIKLTLPPANHQPANTSPLMPAVTASPNKSPATSSPFGSPIKLSTSLLNNGNTVTHSGNGSQTTQSAPSKPTSPVVSDMNYLSMVINNSLPDAGSSGGQSRAQSTASAQQSNSFNSIDPATVGIFHPLMSSLHPYSLSSMPPLHTFLPPSSLSLSPSLGSSDELPSMIDLTQPANPLYQTHRTYSAPMSHSHTNFSAPFQTTHVTTLAQSHTLSPSLGNSVRPLSGNSPAHSHSLLSNHNHHSNLPTDTNNLTLFHRSFSSHNSHGSHDASGKSGYHRSNSITPDPALVSWAKSQAGSRLLQQQLASYSTPANGSSDSDNTVDDRFVQIFDQLKDYLHPLSVDLFGNYCVQKLIEHSNHSQRQETVRRLMPVFGSIAIDRQGTRVIQKLIESAKTDVEFHAIVTTLTSIPSQPINTAPSNNGNGSNGSNGGLPMLVSLSRDVNGTHAVASAISTLPVTYSQPLAELAFNHLPLLAIDQHGICVLKRALTSSLHQPYFLSLSYHTLQYLHELINHQFGNYLISHLLEMSHQPINELIVAKLNNHFIELSKQKYSSNVIERCLRVEPEQLRAMIVKELLASEMELLSLFSSSYGNYVLLAMCHYAATEAQLQRFIKLFQSPIIAQSLRKTVKLKWEKLFDGYKTTGKFVEDNNHTNGSSSSNSSSNSSSTAGGSGYSQSPSQYGKTGSYPQSNQSFAGSGSLSSYAHSSQFSPPLAQSNLGYQQQQHVSHSHGHSHGPSTSHTSYDRAYHSNNHSASTSASTGHSHSSNGYINKQARRR